MMTNDIPHQDLPLPDFDHITTGDLPARIRGLDAGQIETLIEFERSHGGRLPIITVLEQRSNQLAEGAEPTGPVLDDSPTMNHGSAGGGKVSPATSGPTMNPPSHGVPTNPSQPRPEGPPRA
jgi:hypothetical protein